MSCAMWHEGTSAMKFDRVEITVLLALFYLLKPLTGEGGEETPDDDFQKTMLVFKYSNTNQTVQIHFSSNWLNHYALHFFHRLVGLVVRPLPRERKILGIFSGSSHTSDSKIGTPVATLSGTWRYRVSTGTGRPGVSILWLGEVERLICNFHLSVAARKIVWADPSLRYTSLLLGR